MGIDPAGETRREVKRMKYKEDIDEERTIERDPQIDNTRYRACT